MREAIRAAVAAALAEARDGAADGGRRPDAARLAATVERLARDSLAIEAPFDAEPMQLATPGGVVDLATGTLRAADPAARVTRTTAVAPDDRPGPLWRRFLGEAMGGDAALVCFLQRFLGYALTGETSEHAMLFGHGAGGNGKSVFANTVRGILGDYAVVAPSDFLARGRRDARAPSAELAMLEGARLVTAAETEAGAPLAEARLKWLTGGDPITARGVGQAFSTFAPQFKLVVMGNDMPVLSGGDAALRRRIGVVPFAHTPARPDRTLERRLREEWPAILAWMIEGCLAWQAEGLGQPPAMERASDDYFSGQDVVAHFLHERCETGPAWRERASALYADWVAYARAAGEVPGTQRLFGMELEARGTLRERTRHARLYRGLRLLTQAERDAG